MNIKEFVSSYQEKNIVNTKINPTAVEDTLREMLDIKSYLPFAEKRELCALVIKKTCKRKNGIITVDSVSRYIIFTVSILSKYTNLEFNSDEGLDSLSEYDLLCESGLLDEILEVIGQEYAKCNNLLNMMLQDVIDNNNTPEVILADIGSKLLDKVGEITDTLAYKIDEMNLDLNQIDIDKFEPLLEKLGGLIE